MQNDLPDDQRSTRFYSSNVVEQNTVIILDEDDDEVSHIATSSSAKVLTVPKSEDFPSLGGPAAVKDTSTPAPPTAAMGSLNLGRGRGIGRGRTANSHAAQKPSSSQQSSWSNVAGTSSGPSVPGGNPPRSWSSMAQAAAPASTQNPPRSWSDMAKPATPAETSQRPLTQSERSGNVRVIRQAAPLPVPVQGNRPMAKEPKYLTAKRVFAEYKRNAKTASAAVQEIATSLQWVLEEEEVMPDPGSFCNFAMKWKVNGIPCSKVSDQ